MKKIILFLIITILFSCSSDNDFKKGKQQLENQGYTEVRNTGRNWFCCSDSDSFSTGFTCLDKDGNRVSGCFCSAIGKGITIRFE